MTKRRLPTELECRAGIPLTLDNADAHLAAADVLAAAGQVGFAVAHLVYALEESEKARTLGKVVLGAEVTNDELRAALHDHRARHLGAVGKSWTSIGVRVFMDAQKEELWEKLGRIPARTRDERWAEVRARYPLLPEGWADHAGPMRERNLYVDFRVAEWSTPSSTAGAEFARLRPAVAWLLQYGRAAYQREIVVPKEQLA